MEFTTKQAWLGTILTLLIFIDLFVFGIGTLSSLRLANPENKEGPISARELAFRFSNYDCKNPSEFIKLPYIYSGIKRDILYLTLPFNCGGDTGELSGINNLFSLIVSPVILVDIPLSFIADTVMLPYTIPKQKKEGNILDPPYFKMGNLQREEGKKESAKEYYEKGFNILHKYYGTMPYYEIYHYLPEFDEILLMFAQDHEQKGEYDKALFYYENIIEIATRYQNGPSGPAVKYYKDLERLYSKMGNHEKASECHTKANEYAQKYKRKK
jgi:tetratricopeptide (TPR) repeat protein